MLGETQVLNLFPESHRIATFKRTTYIIIIVKAISPQLYTCYMVSLVTVLVVFKYEQCYDRNSTIVGTVEFKITKCKL